MTWKGEERKFRGRKGKERKGKERKGKEKERKGKTQTGWLYRRCMIYISSQNERNRWIGQHSNELQSLNSQHEY